MSTSKGSRLRKAAGTPSSVTSALVRSKALARATTEPAKRLCRAEVRSASAKVEAGDRPTRKRRVVVNSPVDLTDHLVDDHGRLSAAEDFMGKRAEATAGNRRVAEGMRENANQEPSTRVEPQGGPVG